MVTNCTKCTTLVGGVDNEGVNACWGLEVSGKSLYLTLDFAVYNYFKK